jgi:predicted DNA-binding transcriptional regulator YafY
VLALLEILQAGGSFGVARLADRLGVDERTVRRYASHLADLGVPVEAQRGRYGGYRLAPGYKLPPLMLTDDEAVAVVLGLVAGRRAGLVTAAGEASESALAKVRRVLPSALARRIDALVSTAGFSAPGRPAVPPESEVLLALASAARERHPVEIRYTAWSGRSTRRALSPYGLVFHAGRWYVTGHDALTDALRTFRLDRITATESIEGSFDVPADFDPTGHVLAGLASVPYAHEVVVVLETSVAEARRRIPRVVGELVEVPGGVRLTARAERLDGAAQMLAGLPWPFRVARPDELRDELRAVAARLERAAATAPSPRDLGNPGHENAP